MEVGFFHDYEHKSIRFSFSVMEKRQIFRVYRGGIRMGAKGAILGLFISSQQEKKF